MKQEVANIQKHTEFINYFRNELGGNAYSIETPTSDEQFSTRLLRAVTVFSTPITLCALLFHCDEAIWSICVVKTWKSVESMVKCGDLMKITQYSNHNQYLGPTLFLRGDWLSSPFQNEQNMYWRCRVLKHSFLTPPIPSRKTRIHPLSQRNTLYIRMYIYIYIWVWV